MFVSTHILGDLAVKRLQSRAAASLPDGASSNSVSPLRITVKSRTPRVTVPLLLAAVVLACSGSADNESLPPADDLGADVDTSASGEEQDSNEEESPVDVSPRGEPSETSEAPGDASANPTEELEADPEQPAEEPATTPPSGGDALVRATAISAGWGHSCGLLEDGSPVCWGEGDHRGAALAPDNLELLTISAGFGHSCGLQVDGSPVCWGGSASGKEVSPPDGLSLVDITTGLSHSLLGARSGEDGGVTCGEDVVWVGVAAPPPWRGRGEGGGVGLAQAEEDGDLGGVVAVVVGVCDGVGEVGVGLADEA